MITLYHGTSKKQADLILSEGWDAQTSLYLTDNIQLAEYYAEDAMESMDDDDYVILKTTVDESYLLADRCAFDEPISFIRNNHTDTEDEWHQGIENGDIPYPDIHDYQTSLTYTNSVKITDKDILSILSFSFIS